MDDRFSALSPAARARLRQAEVRFEGLRSDKRPEDVVRERAGA